MQRLTELHKLFAESGIKGRPIGDQELRDLKVRLEELTEYMDWRGDRTMAHSFILETESVKRMIAARKN